MDNYIVRFKERRSSLGYGEGQLAFLNYSIPENQKVAESADPTFENSVTTDDTYVNEEDNTTPKDNTASSQVLDDTKESTPSAVPTETSTSSETSSTTTTHSTSEQNVVEVSNQPSAITNTSSTASDENRSSIDPQITQPSEYSTQEETVDVTPLNLTYEPIYYTSGQDLVTERNYDNLENIIRTLKNHPDLKVDLVGHSSSEGIVEYKLFSSLKIAERLKRHLTQEGIHASRIHIKGVGDNYPIILQNEDEPKIAKFTKYNSRVEVYFSEYKEEATSLERRSPDVPSFVQDQRFDLYQTLIDESITYKISIAVVGQMYRNKALDLFNDTSVEEDKTTGLYTYTIGLYDTFADAIKVKRDMERLGVTDARVIAYYDGKMLKEDEHVYYVNRFPDLRGLMNFQN